jgi:hypothetical protein
MDVRIATAQDVPALVALARIEHARSRFKDRPFDAAVATRNFEQAIAGMLTRVFISEERLGFIAGVLQPALFNRYFTAYELCWYAEDGSGIALLNAFCEWARKMRAVEVIVSNYAGIKEPEKFTRVMKRARFDPIGSSYCMKLED